MQASEISPPVITVVDAHKVSLSAHLSPLAMLRSVLKNRALVRQLAWREISARYRGTQLGLFWSVLNPLLMLSVYTYVFCGVMKVQLDTPEGAAGSNNYFSYALKLFAGLTAFNLFSEVVSRAPMLVISCPNYVKKVVFPLEILPLIALGTAASTFFASLLVLIAAELLLQGSIPWTVVFFPAAILPLVLLALALGWLLSSLGVFLRDIGQSIAFVMQLLIFMTPVFYPVEAIPAGLRPILTYSPLTISVESFRQVVLWGQQPDWTLLAIATVSGLLCCQLGFAFFMKTKKAFADVI